MLEALSRFRIDSAIYVVCHALLSLNDSSIIVPTLWKTNYPADILDRLSIHDLLNNEFATRWARKSGRPILWTEDVHACEMTAAEHERWQADDLSGLGVGVSIPLLGNNGHVRGGFGLRAAHATVDMFNEIWATSSQELIALVRGFDTDYRTMFAQETYSLSRQELAVLACIAAGMSSEQAGHRLGLARKTVEAYLASTRRKTRSANTVEAAAKAVFFELF